MALPLVVPAASITLTFDLHHEGRPDLKDPVARAVLPDDLTVRMADVDHKFIKATPCLNWTPVPGAAPTDPPLAMSFAEMPFMRRQN